MADFSFINERLATGAAISSEADAQELWDAGITHVVDCREEVDDAPFLIKQFRHRYLFNGVYDDGQHKPPSWFHTSITFALRALHDEHACVYAHCAAGVNRGPSTAYAIMLACGFDAATAEQMIREARPQVGLAYKADADSAFAALYARRTTS